MTALNTYFPSDIMMGMMRRLVYAKTEEPGDSGLVDRVLHYDFPVIEYAAGIFEEEAELAQDFAEVTMGGAAFLFYSPFERDFQATDQQFGVGDGAETEFQLSIRRVLRDPGNTIVATRSKDIFHPRSSPAPVIKVNGVTKTVTVDYTISASGLVTFTAPPTDGHALTWTGEYDLAMYLKDITFESVADRRPTVTSSGRESTMLRVTQIVLSEAIGE